MLLIVTTGGAPATGQECSDVAPFATTDLGEPIASIHRIDGLDFVVATTVGLPFPRGHTLDPSTLAPVAVELLGGGRLGTLLPWQDGTARLYVADAFIEMHEVDAFGSWEGASWELNSPCDGDSILARPILHPPSRSTGALRAIAPNGLLYMGTGTATDCDPWGWVVAHDLATGAAKWLYQPTSGLGPLYVVRGMALDPVRDLLFVTSEDGEGVLNTLWAIDVHQGLGTWQAHAGTTTIAPARRGDHVYVGNSAGELSAWDSASGSKLWSIDLAFPIVTELVVPVVPPFQDAIFVRDLLHRVHLIRDEGDMATQVWTSDVPNGTDASSYLLAFDPATSIIYAPDPEGSIHRIDAQTGTVGAATAVDSVESPVTAMRLSWPLDFADETEMYASSEAGVLSRLCVDQGDVIRSGLDPVERTELPIGFPSFLNTDTGEASIIVHTLDMLSGPTTLSRFEAVATGNGPCDLGRGPTPCLEQMAYLLMAWEPGVPIGGDIADPANPGKIFHVDVTDRLELGRGYGAAALGDFVVEPALVGFDLTGLDLVLPGAGTRIGVMARGSASVDGWFLVPETGPSLPDTIYSHPSAPPVVGQFAVRLRGETQALSTPHDSTPPRVAIDVMPNPTGVSATILVEANAGVPTVVDIFDVSGRRVARLDRSETRGRERRFEWIDAEAPAGVYFVRARAGPDARVRKIVRAR